MTVYKVSVKWNKQKFDDVGLDTSQPVADFKAILFSLTGVEPDRQKILVKGAVIKDDTDWSKIKLSNDSQFMLMGTPGDVNVDAPEKKTKIEEAAVPEPMQEPELILPAGLQNLGNTCYMNASLQILKNVPELQTALTNYSGNAPSYATSTEGLVATLRELYKMLNKSTNSVPPFLFLQFFRMIFPSFAEQEQGGFRQQDADECFGQIVSVLNQHLKDDQKTPIIDKFFGLEFTATYTNDEDPTETTVKVEKMHQLSCFITIDVNYLNQGIQLGLNEKIDMRSERLGRDSKFSKVSRISRLPAYLVVKFVRFFRRQDPTKNSKILRKVKFPMELDMYEFASEELKAQLQPLRQEFEKVRSIMALKPKKKGNATSSSAMEIDPSPFVPSADGMNHSGYYELTGVLTHTGRSLTSGHYMAWLRSNDGIWLKFDDDKVTPVPADEIMKLDGGGDWHMAYLLLYSEKKLPKIEVEYDETTEEKKLEATTEAALTQ